MSLFEEIRQHVDQQQRMCRVAEILDVLDAADREDLIRAMAAPEIASTAIVTVLGGRGITVHRSSIAKHRKGHCGCTR